MLRRIEFKNFRILRDAAIDLDRFTLLIGPNASGKSTVFRGIIEAKDWIADGIFQERPLPHTFYRKFVSRNLDLSPNSPVSIGFNGVGIAGDCSWTFVWNSGEFSRSPKIPGGDHKLLSSLTGAKVFSLDPRLIQSRVAWTPDATLGPGGERLSVVLTTLQDTEPERFENLNAELSRWLPEFDRILLNSTTDSSRQDGLTREFQLRFRTTKARINAADLSGGTLIALALLTLAHLPDPPGIICLEEPDRGLHPRALTLVRDAIFRLAYPERNGESRKPVQVLATTHSPYFLDLFRDYTNQIVVAEKTLDGATFSSLSKRPDIDKILAHGPLGEIWYSGVLGGVPVDA